MFNLGVLLVVYGEDYHCETDEEASVILRIKCIKVFEANHASLVCVEEGSFIVEIMRCEQQGKSNK